MSHSAGARSEREAVLQPAIALPYRSGRPIRVAALSNPASGKNQKKRRFETVRQVLGKRPQMPYTEVDSREGIIEAAQKLAGDGAEIILVNGGDGTIQAVLTGLLRMTTLGRMPLLVVIPGGTTNMIARNVGSGPYSPKGLEHLLAAAQAGRLEGEVVPNPVIRADFAAADGPIFGMFFGSGAVYHGIHFCRERVHTLGLKGEIGPGLAMMVFIGKLIMGQSGDLLPALRAWGSLDGEPLEAREYFGLLVSTLDRLFLGLRPYWGAGAGPLRYSSVTFDARHKLRAAPAIMRGKPNRYVCPEFGYESRRALEIELHLDTGFTLDGELFDAPGETPIILNGGRSAFFLQAHAQ